MKKLLTVCFLVFSISGNGADNGIEFFENKIRPVLAEKCYRCHSSTSEKLKGGLYLDSRKGVLAGGDSGPSVVPGDPDASLLIESIRYHDPDLEMPPKEKLPDDVVRDFELWVKMGVPDPRETGVTEKKRNVLYEQKEAESHWAFQRVSNPEAPAIDDPWILNPIDAFILAGLKERNLTPSPKAPLPILLKRLSHDLTGLPYTGNAVDFKAALEELLNSKQYGVHWGRHWLDIARYSDHNGGRLAPTAPSPYYPYAWTYRDWVIEAFNSDMPYDQFVLHQIAGDAFASDRNRNPYRALGFLRVGRQFGQNEDDRIDDRIDALTKGFLGLTVACARCHDHKFDPILTADYYSLHGIFRSSEDVDVDLVERESITGYIDYKSAQDKRIAELKAMTQDRFEALVSGFLHRTDEFLLAAQRFHDGELGKSTSAAAREIGLEADIFTAWVDALAKWKSEENPIFIPWFRLEDFDDAEYEMIRAGEWKVHPVVAKKLLEIRPNNRTELAVFYRELSVEIEKAAGRKFPIVELIMNWPNLQRNWIPKEYDQFSTAPAVLKNPEMEELRHTLIGFGGALGGRRLPPRKLMRSGGKDFRNALKMAETEHVKQDGEDPRAPIVAMAMKDKPDPRNSHIFIRGNKDTLGDEAPRAFLSHLAGPSGKPYTEGSGRLELARDIIDRKNPLTARVIVNRVWQWHFGTGLVSTASDFGLNGMPPTHPELLDWLATWFMDNGWSIRRLNRLILTSNTWQQSSQPRADGLDKDPANEQLWRMNPRKLRYEEIRDSMLLATGELDLAIGGRSVPEGTTSHRRTAFLYVNRYELPFEFQIFDFANPDFSTAKRDAAIVPPQALYFLNHPWVEERSRSAVSRAVRSAGSDEKSQLRELWKMIYHREPENRELETAGRLLKSNGGAIDQVAHSLFSSNEFIFVR